MELVVAGLHLTDQPLNHQLVILGGTLVKACRTAPRYKLYLIEDERGQKPGLALQSHHKRGKAYDVEVWSLPMESIGILLQSIPAPLGLGTVVLDDDTMVKGFICEPRVVEESKDISGYAGWKAFLKSTV